MAVRTYSQADWSAADAAWRDGEFSDEWAPVRDLARKSGILFPPSGTKWDSWEDDQPSQRAILIRAIRESPELLGRCIARSRTWHDVIRLLTAERDAWRERQRSEVEPEPVGPTRREAPEVLRNILRRLVP